MKELYIVACKTGFIPDGTPVSHKTDPYLWMCQVQKWFADKGNVVITIQAMADEEDDVKQVLYWFNIITSLEDFEDYEYYHSYEEALKAGLMTAFELTNQN